MDARTTLLALVLCLLAACGESQPVAEWEIFVGGQSHGTITIPAHPIAVPHSRSTYELRADVVFPERYAGRDVDLVIPSLLANANLTIDGVEVDSATRDLVTGYRRTGVQVWTIPDKFKTGIHHFALSVDHTWLQSGWLDTVPRLEVAEGLTTSTALRVLNQAGAWVGFVTLAQVGLIYLAIYAFDRRRKKFLWFALQGITASYYPFWLLGLSQGIFGTYDVNLIGLLLSVAAVMSVYFTNLHFELGPPSRFWRYLAFATIVASFASLDPFFAPWLDAGATLLIFGSVASYQIYVCARLASSEERPIGARILLVCWSVLLLFGLGDFVAWLGQGEVANGARVAPLGLALFAILQSLLLSREHFSTLNRTDELNSKLAHQVDELESKNRDVQVLNQELRRQISQRSHQLFSAMALLDGGVKDAPRLVAGDDVQGRYHVLREIGRGGMGYVYEVERRSDKKHLALKMAAGISAVSLARFAREAKLFATLDHPRIVGIIDVDVAASGFLYLVMEYVEGESLRHQESRYGDIPWALHILHQVAEGLAELHRVGIVHRDLKPANILLSKGGDESQPNIKITDFGVSRLSSPPEPKAEGEGSSARATTVRERMRASLEPRAQDDLETVEIQARDSNKMDAMAVTGALGRRGAESPSNSLIVTRVGEVTGTPHYIAPEAAKGEGRVAPISDMFSLGVLGFEIVVGKRPFSFPAVLAAVAGHEPEEADDLLEACPELPEEIATLIQSCLKLSAEGRPSAQAFADSLHRLLQEHFPS